MAAQDTWAQQFAEIDVSIALNANASSVIALGGLQPTGLVLPAAFTATTTAILFKVGLTSAAVEYLRDEDGSLVYIAVAATNTILRITLPPELLRPWPYIQLVACTNSTGATPVTQGAARTITMVGSKVV